MARLFRVTVGTICHTTSHATTMAEAKAKLPTRLLDTLVSVIVNCLGTLSRCRAGRSSIFLMQLAFVLPSHVDVAARERGKADVFTVFGGHPLGKPLSMRRSSSCFPT